MVAKIGTNVYRCPYPLEWSEWFLLGDLYMLNADDVQLLHIAVELKLDSLTRMKNSKRSEKEFAELYDAQIARYNALKLKLREEVSNASQSGTKR